MGQTCSLFVYGRDASLLPCSGPCTRTEALLENMSEISQKLPRAVLQQEGTHPVRPWRLSSVDIVQVPSHNVLSDHYIIQRQVTHWSEMGRLLSGHLAAEVGGHEVSLGLVCDHQISGCRLEGWDCLG